MGGISSSHRETERSPHHEALGQGDIVKIEWPQALSGPTLGVIINADCDLAHGKTDGVVAILPVYTFEHYLAQFWAPGYIDEVMAQATQAVLSLIGDTDGLALQNWIREVGAQEVTTSLGRSTALKKGQGEKLETELQRLKICLDENVSIIERFKTLCRANPNPGSYARSQITAAKKAMGEGHFFISDLVEHPAVGFVVRMRRIYILPEADVFSSTSAQRSGSSGDRPTAVRIARLTALYRFKVLQVFAQQYSRIGLPDDISALGALAIDDLVATFSGAGQ